MHVFIYLFISVSLTKLFSLLTDWQADRKSWYKKYTITDLSENETWLYEVPWTDAQLTFSHHAFFRSIKTAITCFMKILPSDQKILTWQRTQHWRI